MITNLKNTNNIKLAVIVGGHDYDVPGLKYFLDSLIEVDYFIQDMDCLVGSKVINQYDAVLFFHMNRWGKLSVRNDMDDMITDFIDSIGSSDLGIFILHHALLSYRGMKRWSEICGLHDRELKGFDKKIRLNISVEKVDHPITNNIAPWTMEGERFWLANPERHCEVLLKIKNPDRIDPLAWAHHYGLSRVFSCQSGHGPQEWNNPNFKKVFLNGIKWISRRI